MNFLNNLSKMNHSSLVNVHSSLFILTDLSKGIAHFYSYALLIL